VIPLITMFTTHVPDSTRSLKIKDNIF
jgi:hypothetical protein